MDVLGQRCKACTGTRHVSLSRQPATCSVTDDDAHTDSLVRKIILMLSMSLDGYFEGPGGELDWHNIDEELHQHFNDVLAAMSVFMDGRVNYELMASYWPHADEDPSATAQEREFARIWRDMPKLVYS